MKRKESKYAIECDNNCGPIFGIDSNDYDSSYYDIYIGKQCNKEDSCYIENNGYCGYECHPKYKSSLFVNNAKANKINMFSVFDYEVFGIDYENRDNIYKLCKHPDIIWECIESRNISEESLKQFDDDIEILNELDVIHFEDDNIRLKISKYCLKNPSKLLVGTQIVNEQYDDKLREWLHSYYTWKLLYRSSEHGYTAASFHYYCSYKNPTLIVIKSSEGWIFGGYTTKSWSYTDYNSGIYNDMMIINR